VDRLDDLREAPPRTPRLGRPPVEPVDPDPVDVRVTWVVMGPVVPWLVGNVGVVWRPHPRHVRRAFLAEQVVDVPPRRDVPPRPGARPAVARATPFAPGPVHLPPPPEEHGLLERPNSLRPCADHHVVSAI